MDDLLKRKSLPQLRILGRALAQQPEHTAKRIIPIVSSDGTVDRYGDSINADGWDLRNYDANPVWLWGHNRDLPPIGRSTKHGVEVVNGKRALVQYPQFATKDENPLADQVYRLHLGGFLTSCSVGFQPIDVKRPKDDDERAALGLGKYGVVYVKQELLETSSVSVPANPSAMALSIRSLVERGVLTDEDVEAMSADREHFDESFTAPLREEWGRVRAGSRVTVPGIDAQAFAEMLRADAQVIRDAMAGAGADDDGLTIHDRLVLLTAGIEDLTREVQGLRRVVRVDGGVDPSGGAPAPAPEDTSDPVPCDQYRLLLDDVKASAERFAAPAGGHGNGKRKRNGGDRSGGPPG